MVWITVVLWAISSLGRVVRSDLCAPSGCGATRKAEALGWCLWDISEVLLEPAVLLQKKEISVGRLWGGLSGCQGKGRLWGQWQASLQVPVPETLQVEWLVSQTSGVLWHSAAVLLSVCLQDQRLLVVNSPPEDLSWQCSIGREGRTANSPQALPTDQPSCITSLWPQSGGGGPAQQPGWVHQKSSFCIWSVTSCPVCCAVRISSLPSHWCVCSWAAFSLLVSFHPGLYVRLQIQY